MKKKFTKLVGLIFLFFILISPINNVIAETWKYNYYSVALDDYIPNIGNGTQYYNLTNNYQMHLTESNKTHYLSFHQINNGKDYYLGYCLHAGKHIYNGATLGVHQNFTDLRKLDGQLLTGPQQEVLKNILASGYQNGNKPITNLVKGNIATKDGTCQNTSACTEVLATQILVWEIMAGARTSYDYAPDVNPTNSAYNKLVSKNTSLLNKYKNILDKARALSTEGTVPSVFGKTYTLTWSDAKGAYQSSSINIGQYSVTNKNGLTVSNKNSKNEITISSSKKLDSNVSLEFKKVVGDTSIESLPFRWFKFQKNASGTAIKDGEAQDILLGYYTKEFKKSLSVKTEKGTFTLTKVSSDTNRKLLGSKFELYKCDSNNQCKDKVVTIDLTKSADSPAITLYKSGKYLLKEIQTPFGYDKLDDVFINFYISSNGKANATHYDGANGKIKVSSEGYDHLIVGNEEKTFTINKIDGHNNAAINGASFQIKDSKNNLMNFNLENGVFKYNKDGKTTTITLSNSNTYKISLLPAGEYSLIETAVSYPYILPSSEELRTTKFKVDSDYNLQVYNYTTKKYVQSSNVSITVKNYKTKVDITKVGKKGVYLQGAVFELYNSDKTKQIAVKAMANEEYEYNSDQSSPIQLTTNSKGKIVLNYLPEGTYYLKEVVAPEGYVIDASNEWTKISVVLKRDTVPTFYITISNEKGTFCFYKIDEDGNYLDSGKFKLQMYNEKTSKFEDMPLLFNKDDKSYSIDKDLKSDIYTFSPISQGQTCFSDIETKGRYRIVEIEAPEGFILPKSSDTNAEIIINENGYASGSAVIINKKITTGEGAEAQAELIINIQTGQTRIHYIIIIAVLAIIITGLLILKNKIDKK